MNPSPSSGRAVLQLEIEPDSDPSGRTEALKRLLGVPQTAQEVVQRLSGDLAQE
jgi:hypothetical protein